MASSWAEFCEQTNPGVLSEARGARPFQNAWRVQESISAAAEKRALLWMAERTPAWINSDHLTLLGFLAQILAGVGYALSRWNRYWLMAVIGFQAMIWHGHYRLFDVGGMIGILGMAVMLIFSTIRNTMRLFREERLS